MTVPANIPAPLMGGRNTINLIVNSDDYNLLSAAIDSGWDGVTAADFVVTNNAVHRATSTDRYAFDTGVSYPAGSTITIIVDADFYGKGGSAGGVGGIGVGGPGGSAVRLRSSCAWKIIVNSQIISGGGGGGLGGGRHDESADAWHYGYPGGSPGIAIVAETPGSIDNMAGSIASGGIGGYGGDGAASGNVNGGGGGGGAGEGSGGLGNVYYTAAEDGVSGTPNSPGIGGAGVGAGATSGATGGSLGGGTAISGNSNINWISHGTCLGSIT